MNDSTLLRDLLHVMFLIGLYVAATVFIVWVTSKLSGWGRLGRRFRSEQPWEGASWSWQSLRMGWLGGYNNCVVVGANEAGLYLALSRWMFFFRVFHPPLFVPWTEIAVTTEKTWFGRSEKATFRMGLDEQVSMTLRGQVVARVREAAGAGWPLYHLEQMQREQI